jgi:hypothetical protein
MTESIGPTSAKVGTAIPAFAWAAAAGVGAVGATVKVQVWVAPLAVKEAV